MQFTIPPGFASAIWPAAGIGLGLYLCLGRAALFGVLLASVFDHYIAFNISFQTIEVRNLFISATLTCGTIAQFIITKLMIYRCCPRPIRLSSIAELSRLAFVAGPIACTISATIGTFVQVYSGIHALNEAIFVWFIWWAGDAVGVLFFLPIVLSLLKNDILEESHHKLQIVIPSLLIFVAISFIFWLSREQYIKDQKTIFVDHTQTFSKEIAILRNTIELRLISLTAFFQSSELVSREEFAQYVEIVTQNDIRTRAMGWLPKVEHAQRDQLYLDAKQQGIDDFYIKKMLYNQQMVHAPVQEYYLPIFYIEPLESNKAALGLDVLTHPSVKQNIKYAIENASFVSTPPIRLAQQDVKFTGNVIYYPVYGNMLSIPEQTDRYAQLKGLVEVVIELDAMMAKIYQSLSQQGFDFILKAQNNGEDIIVYDSGYRNDALYKYNITLPWFNRSFDVLFASSRDFESQLADWSSWLTFILGSLFGTVGMFFIMFVIGFNRRLSTTVDKKTKELKSLIKDLEEASHAKNRFMANISHEFRTPLNAIIGYTEIAKRNCNEAKALDYFKHIKHSSHLLLNIINDVLDISKIEAGKIQLEFISFNLYDSAERIKSIFSEQARQKGLDFIIKTPKNPIPFLVGDAMRLDQIIVNLCSNGIKFTEHGRVTLDLRLTQIHEGQALLSITVEDTGIGIPANKIDGLFAPFIQADLSTTRKYGGTGLGLSITSELCDLMKGTIEVQSEQYIGSTFNVQLPFAIDNNKPETSAPTPQDESNELLQILPTALSSDFPNNEKVEATSNEADNEESPIFKVTALIVEDNEINQIIATELLRSLDLKCDIANNGQEALDYLKSVKPDIIFMDLHMPVMDGFDAAEHIVNNPNTTNIPIIAITADANIEQMERAELSGMCDYITKPIETKELIRVLKKYTSITL